MINKKEKAWTGKTGGSRWMQESLIVIFKYINPWWLSPIIAVWVLGYILFQKEGRRGIFYYWRKRQNKGFISSCWHLYVSYFWFGMVVMDRFSAYAGKIFEIKIDGDLSVLEDKRGCVVLSSHVGNQELAGYTFKSKKPMYVLLYLGDTETVHENRERKFEQMNLHILPMQMDGSHVFEMHEILSRGEILSIHGDRLFYNQKSISANLLGQEADFPEGPYRVAAAEDVSVVTMYMMKEKGNRYTLYIRKLSDGKPETMNRQEYMRFLLDSYIKNMEQILNLYPHQWFQYYRFWKEEA